MPGLGFRSSFTGRQDLILEAVGHIFHQGTHRLESTISSGNSFEDTDIDLLRHRLRRTITQPEDSDIAMTTTEAKELQRHVARPLSLPVGIKHVWMRLVVPDAHATAISIAPEAIQGIAKENGI